MRAIFGSLTRHPFSQEIPSPVAEWRRAVFVCILTRPGFVTVPILIST